MWFTMDKEKYSAEAGWKPKDQGLNEPTGLERVQENRPVKATESSSDNPEPMAKALKTL